MLLNEILYFAEIGALRARSVAVLLCTRGGKGSRMRGTFSTGRALGPYYMMSPRTSRGFAGAIRAIRIMSDKIKPDQAASPPAPSPSEQVPEWLGNRLRRMFDDLMGEPVPDEFKALLKQLEDKERGS